MHRKPKANRLQQGRELLVLVAIGVSACFLTPKSGAVQPQPSTPTAQDDSSLTQAELLYRQGTYDKAQQAAENALQANHESPAWLILLGRIADGKDDFVHGAELYKQ